MIKIRISKNGSSVELWVKSVTINACEIELTFYEEDYYDKSDYVFFERNYEAISKLGFEKMASLKYCISDIKDALLKKSNNFQQDDMFG